eukprot:COSAG04_NODE_29443_length_269_cov_0.594118_1_plen_89_part_11
MRSGGCVKAEGAGQVALVDTPQPDECLINVVFDNSDTAAFLANLASGLSGTYVLRVTNVPYTISALNVGPQQEVHMISVGESSSLTFSE